MNDEQLLASCPDFISVGGLLKATPSEEGGERILYFEASNEDVDHQNEVILQKALENSSDYYLRHGNIDLSHYTILGPRSGIANFMEYEIGKPIAVQVNGKRTFVKAQLYRGESPMAKNANMVWDGLTKQSPPMRYYPSVGGSVLSKSVKIDPDTKQKVVVIDTVRWNNTALDRCPVSKTVGEVSTAPVGTFAKSLNGFVVAKALEASYSTDVAALTGGGALGKQSLDRGPKSYHDARNRVSKALLSGEIRQPSMSAIMGYAQNQFGMSLDESAEFTERFMRDIHSHLKRSKS